jgi:hypothetical protein
LILAGGVKTEKAARKHTGRLFAYAREAYFVPLNSLTASTMATMDLFNNLVIGQVCFSAKVVQKPGFLNNSINKIFSLKNFMKPWSETDSR